MTAVDPTLAVETAAEPVAGRAEITVEPASFLGEDVRGNGQDLA